MFCLLLFYNNFISNLHYDISTILTLILVILLIIIILNNLCELRTLKFQWRFWNELKFKYGHAIILNTYSKIYKF